MSLTFTDPSRVIHVDWVDAGPAANPDEVSCTIGNDMAAKVPVIAKFLLTHGIDYAVSQYEAAYAFRVEGEELEEASNPDDEPTRMVPFEPKYRISGCHLFIYADGQIRFEFQLDGVEEVFATCSFNLSEGIPS